MHFFSFKMTGLASVLICLCLMFICSVVYSQDIFDPDRIHEIKIEFDHPHWANKLHTLKQQGNGKRMIARVTLDGEVYDSCGVRYKGNSSYKSVRNLESTKLPFNIKSNHKKKGQLFQGKTRTLKLSNIFRDPSFVREVLTYEIGSHYMHCPRSSFAKVYVNNAYLGLYNCTESIDKYFLNNHFGSHKGTFFKCDPDWHNPDLPDCGEGEKASLVYMGKDSICYQGFYELKSDHGWKDLIELITVLNKNPKEIGKYIDIEETLWMHAFNNVLVNLDSYIGRLCHNYYLYRDTNDIFRPLVWDMNLSFGGFRYSGTGKKLYNDDLQTFSPVTHIKNQKRPLISKLLENSVYRRKYIAHVRTILEDFIVSGKYLERAKAIQYLVEQEVMNDINKLYTFEQFKQNLTATSTIGKYQIIGIQELMEARKNYLLSHQLINVTTPVVSNAKANLDGTIVFFNANVSEAESVYAYYRLSGSKSWSRIEMFDDGVHDDSFANDGIYGTHLEGVSGTVYYYMVALNEDAATYQPSNAPLGALEVK